MITETIKNMILKSWHNNISIIIGLKNSRLVGLWRKHETARALRILFSALSLQPTSTTSTAEILDTCTNPPHICESATQKSNHHLSKSPAFLCDQTVIRGHCDVTRWVGSNLLQEVLWLKQVIGPVLTHLCYSRPMPSIFRRQNVWWEEAT